MLQRRRASVVPLALAAAAAVFTGCGDADDDDGPFAVAPAEVVVAAIRDVAASLPTSTLPDPPVPVVYVVSVAEDGIAAGVQADVASALRDEVDVRFADGREEAVEEGDGAPVPDDGVLLVIGDIPPEGRSVGVPIEIYRNDSDWRKAVFTFESRSEGWRVTSSSEVQLPAT